MTCIASCTSEVDDPCCVAWPHFNVKSDKVVRSGALMHTITCHIYTF